MSKIRIQALPKFPASVEAGDGVTIERHNGVFTFSLDPEGGLFALLNGDNEFAGTNTFSGNVGIGTSSPAPLLQIGDGTGVKSARIAGGGAAAEGAQLEFMSGSDIWTLGNSRAVLAEASSKDFIFYTGVTDSAYRFYNNGSEGVRIDPNGLSIGSSGAAQAPLSLTNAVYDLFVAKPSASVGALLQMQFGKEPSHLWQPGSGGGSVIELNMNFDGGATGSSSRYSSGLVVRNNMQAGTAGAALGALFFADIPATSTWVPDGSGLGGATAYISLAHSARGGDVFGANPFARATTTAAKSVNGMEIDTDNQVNGTLMKQALQIVDVATSVGSCVDSCAINVIAQSGAYGYQDGIRFNSSAGAFPIRSTGTLLTAQGGTIGAGFDIAFTTFTTGNAVLMPNAAYLTGLNAAHNDHKKLIGLNVSDKLSLYNGVALLSAAGNLQLGASGTPGNLTLGNATSGTITLQPVSGALGTVTLSLPAATATLIGKDTTDVLTNKTFDTAGTGNVFRINGTAITDRTGTGSVVLATIPTMVSTGNSGSGGDVKVSGSGISCLNIIGGSGGAQGAQFSMTRGGVQHNFGFKSAIFGDNSNDFVIYGGGANNILLYTNGILGLTIDTGGRANFKASTTSAAPINMPAGTAPTSPVDGDFWYDGTNLKFRVGGTTKTVTLT